MRRDSGKALLPGIMMFSAVVSSAQQQHGSDEYEISRDVFRGLGITGEPSVYEQCANSEYAAVRLFESTAMIPVAITRVESIDGTSWITKSAFDDQGTAHTVTRDLSSAEWKGLIDVIRTSGFWTAEADESAWDPDGPRWFIEACYQGTFHTLMLYPERDVRMQEVAKYLAKLQN